ncbi:MAG: hypothetical protein JXR48_03835 [Candidatus Delongbacteria bacterium]|nr:hypothetical protein [Candidatus Delongbacteria bacterium]MBN2834077.1 hypothetical protein [Candidatus Delongbacteria bacterium]
MLTIEEIENRIWDTWDTGGINEEDYREFEEIINKNNPEDNPELIRLLAEIHIHHSNQLLRNAADLCYEYLPTYPDHVRIHDYFNIGMKGIESDFKKRSHNKIIKFYKKFLEEHPKSIIARRLLIENLISNYRFDESLYEIDKFEKINGSKYYMDVHIGEIQFLKGNKERAFEIWDKVLADNNSEYRAYFSVADLLASYGVYEKAIPLYEKSFYLQIKPRNIDGLISLSQIYEIKELPVKRLEVVKLILEVYRNDYNVIDGVEVDEWKNLVERLGIEIKK